MLAPLAPAKASAEQEQSPTNVNLAQTAISTTLPLAQNGLSARRPRSARWSTVLEVDARPALAHPLQLAKTKIDALSNALMLLALTRPLAAKTALPVVLTQAAEQLLSATRRVRHAPDLLAKAPTDVSRNAHLSNALMAAMDARTAPAVAHTQAAEALLLAIRTVRNALHHLTALTPRSVLQQAYNLPVPVKNAPKPTQLDAQPTLTVLSQRLALRTTAPVVAAVLFNALKIGATMPRLPARDLNALVPTVPRLSAPPQVPTTLVKPTTAQSTIALMATACR